VLTYPDISAIAGRPVNVTTQLTGAKWAVRFQAQVRLPDGLILNPLTGSITGVPTGSPGSYSVVIEVTDLYSSQRTSVVIEIKAMSPTPVLALAPPVLALLTILMALTAGWSRQLRSRLQR
jgi:hypothetical protein